MKTPYITRILIIIMITLLTASCASAPIVKMNTSTDEEVTELTIWLLPGTGMESLIDKYDREHPSIKINVETAQYEDVHSNLQTAFAAGYGAPDISLIERTFVEQFKNFPEHFHNLYDFGAKDVQHEYLDWKWKQAQNSEQTFLLGLPTDIGPLMLAYRKDLFQQAGLPYERNEVSRLLLTWDDYIKVGEVIQKTTGAKLFNNLKIFYRIMFSQLEQQYFDKSTGKLIIEQNPQLRKAWEYTMKAAELELSANIESYRPEWGSAMSQGSFAIMPAPAWMTGMIRSNAPDASGKWDLAQLPPQQHGNWGGSFLTMPKEGKHPEQAFQLIRYLTAPEQQLQIFVNNGNFPSTPGIYEDTNISGKIDPYFSNAPVGLMFSEAANKINPVYEGPYSQVVANAIDDVLQLVDGHHLDTELAWEVVIERIHKSLIPYE
ncbi:MAG: extracellular solute-binding protein [Paenibacillaceae bacterium]